MPKDNNVVIFFSIALVLLLIVLLFLSYNSKSSMDNSENFYEEERNKLNSVAFDANKNIDTNTISSGLGDINASDPLGNEQYNNVEISNEKPVECNATDKFSCIKRDRLTADDLLPSDANSKWAKLNPSTPGDFTDQSYLTAGHHIGIDTVGQSLRNANLQLRADPPNPQVAVSPWGISTIEPDNYSRGLMDIGQPKSGY